MYLIVYLCSRFLFVFGSGNSTENKIFAENNTKYIIVISILAATVMLMTIIAVYFRSKSKKMEEFLVVNNISLPITINQDNQSPAETNSNNETTDNISQTGGGGQDNNEEKHSYVNDIFFTDPELNYEPLQRDGIFPRESQHIYDPLQDGR